MKKLSKTSGITLVALVVTIVVLLILAGVSINLVIGNNGIIFQAKKAVNAMEEAEKTTQEAFNIMSEEINKILGDNVSPDEETNVGMEIKVELQNVKDLYKVGEKLNYIITIKNTSSIDLNNIELSHVLEGAKGTLEYTNTNGGTLDELSGILTTNLQKGESKSFETEYTILREDAGASIFLESIVTTINPIDTNKVITVKDKTKNASNIEELYSLTITYIYENGTTASPTYKEYYLAGETFAIPSPIIDGYSPNYAFIRSDAEGMPSTNVQVTVIYSKT